MTICTRSCYKKRPDHGLIRVVRFVGKKPVEYSLQLYSEKKGMLTLKKNSFETIEQAKGYASLFGFTISNWQDEERDL